MNPQQRACLLLACKMGDPNRKTITPERLRLLLQLCPALSDDPAFMSALLNHSGAEKALAEQVISLLNDGPLLDAYLAEASRLGCTAFVRGSSGYPPALHKLGTDAPMCLWAKGNPDALEMPTISLVGSRDLADENRNFAYQVGKQAARQGYALVSGNARGADSVAQNACLEAGGYVISVLPDSLIDHAPAPRQLLLSENGFNEPFSAPRALHRNYVIHCMSPVTFAAQCTLGKGGTWSGSIKNLRRQWSRLYCFRDGSPAARELEQMGACLIDAQELADFSTLPVQQLRFI